MDARREEIAEKIQDPVWLRTFAELHFPKMFERLEASHRSWNSERESEPAESETRHLPEKGVTLWTFDFEHPFKGSQQWKEIMLTESGSFCVLERFTSSGYVRSDFEAETGFENRSIRRRHTLSLEEVARLGPRIAWEIFARAYNEKEDTEKLAHEYWEKRGCPAGSALDDWLLAERTVKDSRQTWWSAVRQCDTFWLKEDSIPWSMIG